eukprot:1144469-Rhodomonas_salina.1
MALRTFCVTIICCCCCLTVSSEPILVGPGDEWEGIIESGQHNIICFSPGKYVGRCGISISHNITLKGVEGSSVTTIDCGNATRHLRLAGQIHVAIEGIAFVNGQVPTSDEGGGCVLAETAVQLEIRGSAFTACSGSVGGGIRITHGSLLLENVDFKHCIASDSGGGVSARNSTVYVVASTFSRCSAVNNGGALEAAESGVSIRSSTFDSNEAGDW